MVSAAAATDAPLANRYRLLERIGVGGMGSVWEADDDVLHRRVAVKLLSEAYAADETFVERFRREARAAAGLSHPNVAGVFDYGEDGGRPFIVMELIRGETLAERLARGPLPPPEAARIAREAALALQAAHDAGIVHRDVKPGNIMLTTAGDVKVMDFGIAATSWGAPLTQTGNTMGTASYLSPEQAMGHRVTPASDVYSLGVVLYEMLAGRPPFVAESPVAVATAHVHDEPPALGEIAPGAPAELVAACRAALAKDPNARPPSAAAFADLLDGGTAAFAPSIPGPPSAAATSVLPAATEALAPQRGRAPTGRAPFASAPATEVLPAAATGQTPRPRRHRRLGLAWAALLAILVLGIVAAALAVLLRAPTSTPRPTPTPPASARASSPPVSTVRVPSVVGLSLTAASAKLHDTGLVVGGTRTAPGTAGVVVRTDPPAGRTVDRGAHVTLYVGAGAPSGHHKDHHGKKGHH